MPITKPRTSIPTTARKRIATGAAAGTYTVAPEAKDQCISFKGTSFELVKDSGTEGGADGTTDGGTADGETTDDGTTDGETTDDGTTDGGSDGETDGTTDGESTDGQSSGELSDEVVADNEKSDELASTGLELLVPGIAALGLLAGGAYLVRRRVA